MIINLNIDAFKQPCDAIIHQCNCFGVMGGGFAKAVRELYPEAADADAKTDCGSKAKLGAYSCVKGHDGKYIYNLYSQYRYGIDKRHTDYEAFYNGMTAIKTHMQVIGLNSAATPYNIGCGLAGGSWKVVNAILEDIFGESQEILYICKHNP